MKKFGKAMYRASGASPPINPTNLHRVEIEQEIRELNEIRYDSLESQTHVYHRINELLAQLDELELQDDCNRATLEAEEATNVVQDRGDVRVGTKDAGE